MIRINKYQKASAKMVLVLIVQSWALARSSEYKRVGSGLGVWNYWELSPTPSEYQLQ
jgi:hypothetical protein